MFSSVKRNAKYAKYAKCAKYPGIRKLTRPARHGPEPYRDWAEDGEVVAARRRPPPRTGARPQEAGGQGARELLRHQRRDRDRIDAVVAPDG